MIIYKNSTEVLICRRGSERELLDEYFIKGDRDLDDFDRTEHSKDDIIEISFNVKIDSKYR